MNSISSWVLFLIASLISINISANNFVVASVAGTVLTATTNSNPNNVECDDLATSIIATSNEIQVMVRDNNSGSGETFGWDDLSGNTGLTVLNYTTLRYPDIALVTSGGVVP